jgi:3'-phosphoadenosine 5'-phosphosulfate sulfotransferase (PAPS reductase)/FAD synthetase
MKIISFSGGKDSTAMVILAKHGLIDVDVIRMCTLGEWDWPEMRKHVKQVENYVDMEIEKIDLSQKLYKMFRKYGFPHFTNRYCTGLKKDTMNKLITRKDTTYIGITADEPKRANNKNYYKGNVEFPLFSLDLTFKDTLKLCYAEGFDFGGVYNHHEHFNCWCCPLQKIDEIEWIYRNRPELWQKLNFMQKFTDGWWWNKHTVYEFNQRFKYNKKGWK